MLLLLQFVKDKTYIFYIVLESTWLDGTDDDYRTNLLNGATYNNYTHSTEIIRLKEKQKYWEIKMQYTTWAHF